MHAACSSCFKLTTIPWPLSPCGKSAVHQHGGRSPTQQRYPPTNSGSCCIAQRRNISGVENPMKWQNWKVKARNTIKTLQDWCCIHQVYNGMIEHVLNIFSGGDRSSHKHDSSKVKPWRLKRSCVGIHGIKWNVYCTGLWFHRPLFSTWLCVTCFVEPVFAVFLKHLEVLTTQRCTSYSSSDVFSAQSELDMLNHE